MNAERTANFDAAPSPLIANNFVLSFPLSSCCLRLIWRIHPLSLCMKCIPSKSLANLPSWTIPSFVMYTLFPFFHFSSVFFSSIQPHTIYSHFSISVSPRKRSLPRHHSLLPIPYLSGTNSDRTHQRTCPRSCRTPGSVDCCQ